MTGGAGFIGSHLAEALLKEGSDVLVIDDLSTGDRRNLSSCQGDPSFRLMEGDLRSAREAKEAVEGRDLVFHLAGNAGVEIGSTDTRIDFERNITATQNLLEAMKDSHSCKRVVFASTSTVYGEPSLIPTPEDYGPLAPISLYGSSKLAAEALISGYSQMFGFGSAILRLANIIGPRNGHGVVSDFVGKLLLDPKRLEVLGDGTQNKSYLFVDDCVQAFMLASKTLHDGVEFYNVGSDDSTEVRRIASAVGEEMGLRDVELVFANGQEDGRGWKGDVREMLLDTSKLKSIGWRPSCNSEDAVRMTTRSLLRDRAVEIAAR